MPFIKKTSESFKVIGNQIVLTDQFMEANKAKFKKITGSRFASILNMNNFSSPVKTWAIMVGIYSEPMDKMIADAGNIIEPKIKDYVEQKTGIKYKQYNPFEINFDVFSDIEIFGGIPDGEPINAENKVDYTNHPMLEIKTTAIDSFMYKKEGTIFVLQKDENNAPIVKSEGTKREKWFDSDKNIVIPIEYKMQLGLYCYLRKITKGLFAICFLKKQDYLEPKKCDVNKREVKLINFNVNLELLKHYIDQAEKWYKDFILTGKSPSLTQEDLEWLQLELKQNEQQ